MRALLLLTLVAMLAASVFGLTAPATQEQAKNLREQWKNCSQIVKGRLGVLANADDTSALVITADGNIDTKTHFSPCVRAVEGDDMFHRYYLTVSLWNNDTYSANTYKFDQVADKNQIAQFFMPTKKGDVAHFVATYTSSLVDNMGVNTAVVTVNCGDTTDVAQASISNATLNVVLTNLNACARFPYTNEAMPAGAVAALIVCILCFVLQFAVCGWYHKTYSQDVPFSSGREDAYTRHE